MQVTIYRIEASIASGFRVWLDNLTLDAPQNPDDVVYSSAVYDLPEGYTTDVDQWGQRFILDEDGHDMCPCLLNHSEHSPVLLIGAGKSIAIHKASAPESVGTLRATRLKAGLTQKQLADASGVNVRQIQRVENGESEAGNLTARNLLAIADALGVDPHELI